MKLAPMGDPMQLQIHGYELTLRLDDADQIEIEPIDIRTRSHEGAKILTTVFIPAWERMENIM